MLSLKMKIIMMGISASDLLIENNQNLLIDLIKNITLLSSVIFFILI